LGTAPSSATDPLRRERPSRDALLTVAENPGSDEFALVMRTVRALSHTEAMEMLRAVQKALDEKRQGAAVAVVDAHGELLAMLRTDGCRLSCIDVAINKAYTAAREQCPSKALGDAAKREGFPVTNFGELRYVTWGGGIPITTTDGEVVGAVGVSGLTEAEDTALAEMAAKLVSHG
jgi:glc operon protein GlcG